MYLFFLLLFPEHVLIIHEVVWIFWEPIVLVVVPIIIFFYTTIIISRIITTTDVSRLECVASFYSLGVEIVVTSVRKVIIVVVA